MKKHGSIIARAIVRDWRRGQSEKIRALKRKKTENEQKRRDTNGKTKDR